MKKLYSIHVVVGLLDDKAPERPLICRPFSIPRWLVWLGLMLFSPKPALTRLVWWWDGVVYQVEDALIAIKGNLAAWLWLGRVVVLAPVWAIG